MSESRVKDVFKQRIPTRDFNIFINSLFGPKKNVGKVRTLNEYEQKALFISDDGIPDWIEETNLLDSSYRKLKHTKFYRRYLPFPEKLPITVDTRVDKRNGKEITKVKLGTAPTISTSCLVTKGGI